MLSAKYRQFTDCTEPSSGLGVDIIISAIGYSSLFYPRCQSMEADRTSKPKTSAQLWSILCTSREVNTTSNAFNIWITLSHNFKHAQKFNEELFLISQLEGSTQLKFSWALLIRNVSRSIICLIQLNSSQIHALMNWHQQAVSTVRSHLIWWRRGKQHPRQV